MIRVLALAAAALAAAAAPATAQSLADRVAAVREGTVAMRFRPRAGVCGNEDGGIRWMRNDGGGGDWMRGPCVFGPAVVTLSRTGGDVVSVRLRIGMRPTDVTTDLGDVPPREAATYLASLAHHVGGRSGNDALMAAVIAEDYDVWPDFRGLVLDADAPMQSREQALFWIGQSDTPTANVVALYGDLTPQRLREHYTFVLSQRRDDDRAIDKLIDVARHDRDTDVRKQAMFWLGQSHSAKATKFFRDVLTP
jgi:hypothetical protein